MEIQDKKVYCFADVEVDVLRGSLRCGGEDRYLRPKTFQVLIYLIEHRGGNILKDDLIEDVWKDTAVVDDVLVQSIKDIRRALDDNPHRPRFIKTIPKIGYRFIGTVEENPEKFDDSEKEKKAEVFAGAKQEENEKSRSSISVFRFLLPAFENRFVLISIVSFILISIVPGFVGRNVRQAETKTKSASFPSEIGKKSLVVMFFENRSNTPEFDWLREGLADMLITNFSRSPKLNILSRKQFSDLLERDGYQGDKISFEQSIDLAQKNNADNFITGSFVKAGEKIRLDVQLYDAPNGSLIAAESFTADKPEQILTEIDLLSMKLAKHLGIDARENQNRLTEVMTDDLEAYRYYSLGVEKAQALHSKEAIGLLEKAIKLDPKFAMAYARIGYAYAVTWNSTEKGKPFLERAFQLSERLTEKDRLNISAWYAIANLDYESAIRQFREIIAKYPAETESYQRLAWLLFGEGQTEEAIQILKQGLTIDPKDKNLYNRLGGFLSALGQHSEAISAQQYHVTLAPSEPNAYDSLGMTYQWAGDYRSAIENYQHALELNPEFEIALVHLANTKFQIGQYDEAIALYRRYIKNAPSIQEQERGLSYIASVYLKKQNEAAAQKTAEELLKIRRDSFSGLFILAQIRNDAAKMQALENQLNPKHSNRGAKITQRYFFYFKGFNALKTGQTEEAIANFREAVRQSPPAWDAEPLEDCLADAYFKLGKLDEAAAEYERILQLNPNYPLARFRLAQVYEQKGLYDRAQDSYRQFLDIWKNADTDIPEVIIAKKVTGQS